MQHYCRLVALMATSVPRVQTGGAVKTTRHVRRGRARRSSETAVPGI